MAARRSTSNSRRAPLRTPDGRYLVIEGRLWRAANPDLPDAARALHTKELMRGRRAVRLALRGGDEDALRAARRQVDRAKKALGERGAVWWKDGEPDQNRWLVANTSYAEWYARIERLEALIVQLLDERETSWCPSEIARRASPEGWRSLMQDVRTAAAHLAAAGIVAITQRGRAAGLDVAPRGPIRIRRAKDGSA